MMIKLTNRQEKILELLTTDQAMTGYQIDEKLSVSRATLRPDLAILSMRGLMAGKPRVGYVLNTDGAKEENNAALEKQLVSDFKGRPVAINETASLYDAVVHLCLEQTSSLYVVNSAGHLKGALSKKDLLLSAINNDNLENLPVSVIMARMPNLVTVTLEDTLLTAAKRLIDYQIDSLPVVKLVENDPLTYELTGRITKTTITKAYLELDKNY